MKKRKILAFIPAFALLLSGCSFLDKAKSFLDKLIGVEEPAEDKKDEPSGEEQKDPTDPSDPTDPTTPEVEVKHQAAFIPDLEEGTLTRAYNDKFDVMIDDFSSETLKGTLTGGAKNEGLLRVLVDSENGDYPNSPDASIYKLAAAQFDSAHPDVVGFRMRKVGEGTLSTNDLILGLRGDDAYKVYEIGLDKAFNSDNEKLPELTSEFQDIEIDFGNTIEDDTTEYALAEDGAPSGVRVLDRMVGFHFFAKSGIDVSQVIEIEEVYTVKGTTKTVVDNFQHPRANKNTTIDCWWSDSTGFIVRRGVNLLNGSYEVALPAEALDQENLVLELNGNGEGLKVNGKEVNLKPVNGAFHDLVLNLSENEIQLGETLTLESAKDLNVSAIFASNLKEKEAATSYPIIDIANRKVFDDFNRTQDEFIPDWDIASTADYSPDEISVALSYSQGNLASVHDGILDIQQPEGGYVNVKEACYTAEQPYQYLVIVAKGNLEGFRLGSSEVMWSHDWLAGAGLKSIPEDLDSYEYQKDGFVHYIIDLQEMNSDIGKDAFIDMYFNNAVQIDSIYFARKAANYGTSGDNLNTAADLSGYNYMGYVYLGGAYQVDLHIEGEGSLHSFRFGGDAEYWFKDAKVIGLDGNAISDELTFDAEHPLDISIDVVASGWLEDGIHLHAGGFDGVTGNVTLAKYTRHYSDPWRAVTPVALNSGNEVGYAYLGGFGTGEGLVSIFELTMVAEAEGATLETLRFEGDGGNFRFANQGQLILEGGEVLAADIPISADPANPTVIRIDMMATFNGGFDGWVHIHFGGWGTSDANITFAGTAYSIFTAAYEISVF